MIHSKGKLLWVGGGGNLPYHTPSEWYPLKRDGLVNLVGDGVKSPHKNNL